MAKRRVCATCTYPKDDKYFRNAKATSCKTCEAEAYRRKSKEIKQKNERYGGWWDPVLPTINVRKILDQTFVKRA